MQQHSRPISIQTQALSFLAVFIYATHAKQAIAFEWKPVWYGIVGFNVPIDTL